MYVVVNKKKPPFRNQISIMRIYWIIEEKKILKNNNELKKNF